MPRSPRLASDQLDEQATITFDLPIGDLRPIHQRRIQRHVEAQLDAYQGAALIRLVDGYAAKGAKLKCGRFVGSSAADALRYFLETLGDEIPDHTAEGEC